MKKVMKVVKVIVGGLCIGELLSEAYIGRATTATYQKIAIDTYPGGVEEYAKLGAKEQYNVQFNGAMKAFEDATKIYKLWIGAKINNLKSKFKAH